MDKLELGYQGGDPLTLDDLEFMQNALRDGIKGLASIWNSAGLDAIIISGIAGTVSGLNTTWTSGYIVVNSEVYYVPAATTVTVGSCIDISETIDTNGDETFENLVVNSTYKVRRGVLKNMVGGPNEIDLADFVSLSQRIIQITNCVVNQETAWQVLPTLTAGFSETTMDVAASTLRYRKNKIGEVEFRGILNSVNINGLAFTLPVGFRPVQEFVSMAYVLNTAGGTSEPKRITILNDGQVIINTSLSATQNISLDMLRFPTT